MEARKYSSFWYHVHSFLTVQVDEGHLPTDLNPTDFQTLSRCKGRNFNRCLGTVWKEIMKVYMVEEELNKSLEMNGDFYLNSDHCYSDENYHKSIHHCIRTEFSSWEMWNCEFSATDKYIKKRIDWLTYSRNNVTSAVSHWLDSLNTIIFNDNIII